MRAAAIVAVLILATVLPSSLARHGCTPTTSQATLMVGDGSRHSTTAYVVVDKPSASDPFIPAPWVYMESNGRDGLQRHDDFKDDTCNGEIAGDWLVF